MQDIVAKLFAHCKYLSPQIWLPSATIIISYNKLHQQYEKVHASNQASLSENGLPAFALSHQQHPVEKLALITASTGKTT
jgi:hypothetical protein